MRKVIPSLAACTFLALAAAPACSGSGDDDAGGGDAGSGNAGTGNAGSAWQGATPHLELEGSVAEKELDLDVDGDDAADLGTVYCERNYIVPDVDDSSTWVDGYLEKVEIKLNFFYEDALAEFQMELVRPDLLTSEGETFTVPDDAEVNLGLTTDVDGPGEEEFEDVATGGTITLELLSGDVSDVGVIPDEEGVLGAYVAVELESGGTFEGSFTVNCGENDLEVPE